MVPESATAIFTAAVDAAELDKKLQDFAAAHKVSASLKENGDALEVTAIGKSAHGSTQRMVSTEQLI